MVDVVRRSYALLKMEVVIYGGKYILPCYMLRYKIGNSLLKGCLKLLL